MKHPWQDFLELLWPSRYDPIASRERRIALLLPAPQMAVLRSGASAPAKALALLYVTAHASWCLALVLSGRSRSSSWPD